MDPLFARRSAVDPSAGARGRAGGSVRIDRLVVLITVLALQAEAGLGKGRRSREGASERCPTGWRRVRACRRRHDERTDRADRACRRRADRAVVVRKDLDCDGCDATVDTLALEDGEGRGEGGGAWKGVALMLLYELMLRQVSIHVRASLCPAPERSFVRP